MRRTGRCAAICLVGLLLAGSAAAATITRARARAIVAAVELRHGDLPGTTAVPNPLNAKQEKFDEQLDACVGSVPVSRELAAGQSPEFNSEKSTPLLSIGSFADVLPSSALVATDFAESARPRALACTTNAVSQSLGTPEKGMRISSASTVFIAAPVGGLEHQLASRTTVEYAATGGGGPVLAAARLPAVYVDLDTCAVGQVEFELEVVSVLSPPPAATERRLLELLAARARSALSSAAG